MEAVDGAVAIVTGGGSGIGAELVTQLSAAGASVLAADVDADALAGVAAATGCRTQVVDVTDAAANQAMVDEAVGVFGGLDLAFLNAGILGRPVVDQGTPYTADGLDGDRYRAVMAVNVDGVVYGALAAWKAMAASGGGAVIVTASAAGLVPWPPDPFYTVTKHGVVGWVRAVADAMATESVSIDAICPGGVATPLVGAVADDAELNDNLLAPSDVARAMIDTALEPESGRAVSVVAGRDPLRQVHDFNPIPGFG